MPMNVAKVTMSPRQHKLADASALVLCNYGATGPLVAEKSIGNFCVFSVFRGNIFYTKFL